MNEYYVECADSYMRYQDFSGNRTPILFIHGLGCAGSFDYPQVVTHHELSGHRIILVDLLGAGYSDKPSNFEYSVTAHAQYLKEFMDELSINEFILFGHSLGGPVAIELAKMCENKVTHLILSESNLDASLESEASYKIAHFSELFFVETGFQKMIKECRVSGNTMWAATLYNWSPIAVHRFSLSGVQGGSPSWRGMLYGLPVKKSFIYGEKSLPDENVGELQRRGIHVETVPNAGHSMAWENPKGLALAIVRCLKSS